MYTCNKQKNLQSKNHKVLLDIVFGPVYLFIRQKTALHFEIFGETPNQHESSFLVQIDVARTDTGRRSNWQVKW